MGVEWGVPLMVDPLRIQPPSSSCPSDNPDLTKILPQSKPPPGAHGAGCALAVDGAESSFGSNPDFQSLDEQLKISSHSSLSLRQIDGLQLSSFGGMPPDFVMREQLIITLFNFFSPKSAKQAISDTVHTLWA